MNPSKELDKNSFLLSSVPIFPDIVYVVENVGGARFSVSLDDKGYLVAADSPQDALACAKLAAVSRPQTVVRASRNAIMPGLIKGFFGGVMYVPADGNAVLFGEWGEFSRVAKDATPYTPVMGSQAAVFSE